MASSPRPIRVLVSKVGLDGHDRGLLTIAKALENAGMEVIYGGIRRTARQVAAAAVQEDAEAVGLSSLSGAHLPHFPRVAKELKRLGRKDILLFCGGIIPTEDVGILKRAGFSKVFGPGSTLKEIVGFVKGALRPARPAKLKRLDHISIAAADAKALLPLYRDALGMKVEGEETVEGQRVRATFLSLGDVRLEIVEPTGPDSPVAQFLSKRGGGIHHVAFEAEPIGEALERIKAAGIGLIHEKPVPGSRGTKVAFLHPSSTHKVLLELAQHPRGRRRR